LKLKRKENKYKASKRKEKNRLVPVGIKLFGLAAGVASSLVPKQTI